MKPKRLCICLMLCALLLGITVPFAGLTVSADDAAPTAESDNAEEVTVSNKINSQKRDNIIINAYLVPLQTAELRQSMFALCRDADIDVLSHVYVSPTWVATDHNYEKYAPIMAEAAEYGLKILTRDWRAQSADSLTDEQVTALANEYKDLPGFGGFYVVDEPYYPNTYAHADNILRKAVPGTLVNVNFFPCSIYPDGVYYRHLVDYGAITDADGTLSMDCYCFGLDGSVDEVSLFTNYNAVRLAGLKTSQNTAVYVQSVGLIGAYRTPGEGDLRYNIMAALAYGVKEIKYFTWGTSPSGLYEDAVIGSDYQPTERYEFVCRINKKVHTIGTYLAGCDAYQVYHTHKSSSKDYDALPEDSLVSFDGSRVNLIVSFLQERDGDDEYMMIVNKEFARKQNVTMYFKGVDTLQVVNDTTGQLETVQSENGKFTFSLEAGDSILYKLPAGDFVRKTVVDTPNLAVNAVWKASSSPSDTVYYVADLFDGNTETGARFTSEADGNADQYLIMDFGESKTFNRVDLSPLGQGEACGTYFPKTVTVSVSDDGLTWRTVAASDEQTLFADRTTVPELRFADTQARYVKLTFGGFAHAGQFCELSEVAVYNETEENKASLPQKAATAYTAPTLSADTDLALGKPCFHATSGADTAANITVADTAVWRSTDVHEYRSSEEALTVDLTDVFSVNRVVLTAGAANAFPDAFEIQVSCDGVHFTTASAVSGAEVSGDNRTVTVSFEPTAARYVRLAVLKLSEAGYAEMAQISVFGSAYDGTVEFPTDKTVETAAIPDETDAAAEGGCKGTIGMPLCIGMLLTAALMLLAGHTGKIRLPKNAVTVVCLCCAVLTTALLCGCGGDPAGNGTEADTAAETTPDDGYIREPDVNAAYTPADGVITQLTVTKDMDAADAAANAFYYTRDGQFAAVQVQYAGEAYTPVGFLTAGNGECIGMKLSGFADSVLPKLTDGYTIEVGVMFTDADALGAANRAVFSGTEYGLFGIFVENGHFKLVHYDADKPVEVTAAEAAAADTLYHVVGVYNAAEGRIALYINGSKAAEAEVSSLTVGQADGSFCLGADADGNGAWGSYANYPAFYTAACLREEPLTEDGIKESETRFKAQLKESVSDMTSRYNPSELFWFDDICLRGNYKVGDKLTLTGGIVNDGDTDRTVRLKLDFPSEKVTCDTPLQEIPVKAHDAVRFAFTVQIAVEHPENLPLTVSALTGKDTVINTASVYGVERGISVEKTHFEVGEDIIVTATGGADDWVGFYLKDYYPGEDAAIYYAYFDVGTDRTAVIEGNKPINLRDFPGTNKGNSQCDPYLSLPRGDYKLILFSKGYEIAEQIDITVGEPWEGVDASGETGPYLYVEQTEYKVGEKIYVQASGEGTNWIAFYPSHFVPGSDASIYATYFAPNTVKEVIEPGKVIAVQEFPGNNWGNWQAEEYRGLPAGEYKIILFSKGYSILKQIDITIK